MVKEVIDIDLRRNLQLLPLSDRMNIPAETQVETEEAGETDFTGRGRSDWLRGCAEGEQLCFAEEVGVDECLPRGRECLPGDVGVEVVDQFSETSNTEVSAEGAGLCARQEIARLAGGGSCERAVAREIGSKDGADTRTRGGEFYVRRQSAVPVGDEAEFRAVLHIEGGTGGELVRAVEAVGTRRAKDYGNHKRSR